MEEAMRTVKQRYRVDGETGADRRLNEQCRLCQSIQVGVLAGRHDDSMNMGEASRDTHRRDAAGAVLPSSLSDSPLPCAADTGERGWRSSGGRLRPVCCCSEGSRPDSSSCCERAMQ